MDEKRHNAGDEGGGSSPTDGEVVEGEVGKDGPEEEGAEADHATLHTRQPPSTVRMVNFICSFFPVKEALEERVFCFTFETKKLSPTFISPQGYFFNAA